MASQGHKFESTDLQLLVDSVPALIHTALPDGYLDFFNQTWLRYLGLPLEDLQGWKWTAAIHPEDVEGMVDKWRASLASGEPALYEARVRRADGEYRWMLHCTIAERDKQGTIVKWYGSSIDIEDRKQAEERLRQDERELRQIVDVVPQHIFVLEPDGQFLYSNRGDLEYTGLTLKEVQEDFIGRVWHPDDLERHLYERQHAIEQGIPWESEIRLRGKDRQYRWFLIRLNPLRDEQGRIIRWYGARIDIEDRKRAEQALIRSEAYLTEAQRLTHTGSWAFEIASDSYVHVSEECLRVFGLDSQEVSPTREVVFRRIHPDDSETVKRGFERSVHEKVNTSNEFRIVLPDGAVKTVHVTRHPVLNSAGDVVKLFGVAVDITERKQAEEALRESETRFRTFVDHAGDALFVQDLEQGTIVDVNRQACESLGYTRQELIGNTAVAFHPDLDRAQMESVAGRAAAGETVFDTHWHRRKDGSTFPVEAHTSLFSYGGRRFLLNVARDISDRVRAEEKLRQEERELRQIVDVIPQHIFVLEPDGRFLYVNRRDLEYFGLTLEDVLAPDHLAKVLHPDDLERLLREREQVIAQGTPWESEARLLGKDGQYRWFLIRLNPLWDEQGRIIRWYGTRTDIEDRKQAEDGLQTALDEVKKLRDQLYNENIALREEIDKASMFEEIVGTSPALQSVLSRVAKVAPTDSTVLITGETGTGKELIARAIHKRSHRSSRAFVTANCAAIPRDLIASELFGHEKGAFTGATQQRLGRFELAGGGTIFLDEVGELPAETQIALLRVLQEHEFDRVGGTRSIQTNVRVIAATNRDLQAAIAAGTFRSDLFYRLNVFPIEIPPLRERREDIPLLVEYFIDRYARQAGKRIRGLNKKTLELFQSYPWPGNIRELQNVIQRSVIVCESEIFSVDESWLSRQPLATKGRSPLDLSEKLAAQEKEMIEAALRECGGRVFGPSGAAAKLGMPRSTLESKIRSLKIDKNRFKTAASLKGN
ncbi:MAG: PAS domain S-box protein [Candidatus Acidiferrum sp.]